MRNINDYSKDSQNYELPTHHLFFWLQARRTSAIPTPEPLKDWLSQLREGVELTTAGRWIDAEAANTTEEDGEEELQIQSKESDISVNVIVPLLKRSGPLVERQGPSRHIL